MSTTQQISISMNGTWAGSGRLVDGRIEDCGAQFCSDNDASLEIYDDIETAIGKGRDSVKVTIDGESHKITWSLVDAE